MQNLARVFEQRKPPAFKDSFPWANLILVFFVIQTILDSVIMWVVRRTNSTLWRQTSFEHVFPGNDLWLFLEGTRSVFRVIYTTGWIFTTYAIYLVHVYRFHQVTMFFFDYYTKFCGIRQLRIQWWRIHEVRERDQQLLSIVPFIWTSNIFFKSFANAIGAKIRTELLDNDMDLILQYTVVAKDIFMILTVIFSIEWINRQARLRLKKFRSAIMHMPVSSPEFEILLNEVTNSIDFIATGWSMFTLNKGFILSFLSALISFSILFMNLVDINAGEVKQ
jgi:hypothetical protein